MITPTSIPTAPKITVAQRNFLTMSSSYWGWWDEVGSAVGAAPGEKSTGVESAIVSPCWEEGFDTLRPRLGQAMIPHQSHSSGAARAASKDFPHREARE